VKFSPDNTCWHSVANPVIVAVGCPPSTISTSLTIEMGLGLVLKPEMGVEGARWVDRWKGGWVDGWMARVRSIEYTLE